MIMVCAEFFRLRMSPLDTFPQPVQILFYGKILRKRALGMRLKNGVSCHKSVPRSCRHFPAYPACKIKMADESGEEFYCRYYVGHKGKFGHEFLEFEIRPDGKCSYIKYIFFIVFYFPFII